MSRQVHLFLEIFAKLVNYAIYSQAQSEISQCCLNTNFISTHMTMSVVDLTKSESGDVAAEHRQN